MSDVQTAKPPVQQPTAKAEPKAYDFHPLANRFPRVTEEEFKALIEDIRVNGLHQPIVVYQAMILDGRHRYSAAIKLGLKLAEQDFTEFKGNEDEALKFVISQNLHRRHLNESQRGLIAAEISNLKRGANQYTKTDGSIDLPTAAKMLNVSEKTLKRARTVLEKAAPAVVEQIRSGGARVSAVSDRVLALPHDEQVEALKTGPAADANTACTNAENSLIKKLEALPLDEVEVRVPALVSKLRAIVAKMTETAEKKKKAA